MSGGAQPPDRGTLPRTAPLRFAQGSLLTPVGDAQVQWPRFAVLGDPIAHSLSPRLHGAALRERREAGEYRAVQVRGADLAACLASARRGNVQGLNITAPHKPAALRLSTEGGVSAHDIGVANTLLGRPNGWRAENTDADGLRLALERFAPRAVERASGGAVVVGGGGAARAAVHALASLGVAPITVAVRNSARVAWARAAGVRLTSLDEAPTGECSLLVQATPLGWSAQDPAPVDATLLRPECLVVDLTYGAHPSLLLRGARARGCETMDGLPMLVAQAALAFALFLGGEPPLAVMASSVGLRWP